MQVIVNRCFGAFGISQKYMQKLGLDYISEYDPEVRTNPELIQAVSINSSAVSGSCANLQVVDIPDEATDYLIESRDGYEYIVYCLDGKILKA